MAELKTRLNNASVDKFLKGVKDEQARADCYKIIDMMKKATQAEPNMWGTSIIGFGTVHLKYESGRELDWFPVGFSPRKQNITIYLSGGMETQSELLGKLGKHSTGKGCLYIKKLEDVDTRTLQQMINNSVKFAAKNKA